MIGFRGVFRDKRRQITIATDGRQEIVTLLLLLLLAVKNSKRKSGATVGRDAYELRGRITKGSNEFLKAGGQ